MAGSPQKLAAQEVTEMLVSPAELAGKTDPPDEPTTQPASAAPSAEASSTEVLITAQQVLFNTAAAQGVRPDNIGGRVVAIMRRMFATSMEASRPRPHYPKRYAFIEDAAMACARERL